jgi:hypothetical protein
MDDWWSSLKKESASISSFQGFDFVSKLNDVAVQCSGWLVPGKACEEMHCGLVCDVFETELVNLLIPAYFSVQPFALSLSLGGGLAP